MSDYQSVTAMSSILNSIQWSRGLVIRYILLQVPGLLIFGAFLYGLQQWIGFSSFLFWIFVGLWICKDGCLFPFVWSAYHKDDRAEIFSMVGLQGSVSEDLNPEGLIRVRGEIWKARIEANQPFVFKGELVKVIDQEGLMLVVQAQNTQFMNQHQ